MNSILVIDDVADFRATLARSIGALLDDPRLRCVAFPPQVHLEDYLQLILEHHALLLILDERLNEEVPPHGPTNVQPGHVVVDFVRRREPELPIYVITNYDGDPDLRERFPQVEDIISRQEFLARPEQWIPRMLRAATQYASRRETELVRLSELASRVALDTASPGEIRELKALQTRLDLRSPSPTLAKRSELVSQLERHLAEVRRRLRGRRRKGPRRR